MFSCKVVAYFRIPFSKNTSEGLLLIIHWDKTQILRRFPSKKIKVTKKCPLFFFRKLQLITALLSIHDSYTSWSTRFISLKLCVEFSIFDFVWFLLKFICLFAKSMESMSLKRHNSFKNENNRKATHSVAPRILIFKLQQKVWKFNGICVSWRILKTDLETNLLSLQKSKFSVNIWHSFT